MKVEITKELREVEIRKYIASDGKEFSDLKECTKHEESLKRKEMLEELKKIERLESADGYAQLDGTDICESHCYYWFKPKTSEEIRLLNDAFKLSYLPLDDDDVGEWICIEGYDIDIDNLTYSDDCYVNHLRDSIYHIQDFLSKFGYEVEIRKASATEKE